MLDARRPRRARLVARRWFHRLHEPDTGRALHQGERCLAVSPQGRASVQPTQWRGLNQILLDEDSDKCESNLKKVEEEHRKPNEVWAQRAEELNKIEWSKFFEKVGMTLAEVYIGKLTLLDSEQTERAKALISQIKTTIKEIENNG